MPSRWLPAAMTALGLVSLLITPARAQWTPNGTGYGTAANDQLHPAICPDGAGGAFIAWSDSRPGPYDFDIYVQRINSVGIPLWTANGVAVCTEAGDQILPEVVSDGAGGAIIVWEDFRAGNGDIYVQRVDSTGTIQWASGGLTMCTHIATQTGVVLVPDGTGGAIAVWEDFRAIGADLYGQRVNSAGVLRWTADGRAICTAGEDQFTPRAIPSGTGAIVTWFDGRNFDFDVFAQRVDSTGASQWTANGVGVCLAPGFKLNPVIATDEAGGAVIAWEDFRDDISSFDIYAQRVASNGTPLWTVNGISLVSNEWDQVAPTICSDGTGGAIVAWQDNRAALPDIYARRIDGSGVPQWAADGIPVSTATGTQQVVRAISDGAGGAILAWEDLRASVFNTDLYAQRLDPAGNPLWAPNGLALTTAGTDQVGVVMASDGANGVLAAWEDGRAMTSSDVYAQRISGTGIVAPTTDVPRLRMPGFGLVSIRPNPCRTATAIRFALPAPMPVTAEVFDLNGRRVRALASGAALAAGLQTIGWDARDESGARVDAGLYWLRVSTPNGVATGKVTVLR